MHLPFKYSSTTAFKKSERVSDTVNQITKPAKFLNIYTLTGRETKPVRSHEKKYMAKSNIKICLGSSCFARGNNVNLEFIQKYLKENQQEADIIFSGHLCENKCGAGPVMSINEHVYEEVNLSRLQKILQEEFTQQ